MQRTGRGRRTLSGPAEAEGLPVQLQPQGRGALADLALSLRMKHALCVLPIDGHDDVARPDVSSLSPAPLCYL